MNITIYAPSMIPCRMVAHEVTHNMDSGNPVVIDGYSQEYFEFAPIVVIANDRTGEVLYAPPESIEDWPDEAFRAMKWRWN